MTELKTCPFCGGKAISYDYEAGNFYPNYITECSKCSARIKPINTEGYDAKEITEKLWNTRQQAINWKPIEELTEEWLINQREVLLFCYGTYVGSVSKNSFDGGVHISTGDFEHDEYFSDIKKKYTHFAEVTPPPKG